MARIQTATVDRSAAGRGMANLGRSVQNLGGTLHSIAGKFEEADEFDTERRYQEFKWSEKTRLEDEMRTTEPGKAKELPTVYSQGFNERAREFFSTVPQPLKQKYDEKLFNAEQVFVDSATTFSRGEQKRAATAVLDEHKERLAPAKDLDAAKVDLETLLELNRDLTPIEKDEWRRKALGDLETKNLESRIDLGDETVDKDIDDAIAERQSKSVTPTIRDLPRSGIHSAPRKSAIAGVVVHHTAGSSLEGALSHGGKTRTGTNYYVERDGTVVRAAPEDQRTTHIREPDSRYRSSGGWKNLTNDNTVGIEVVAKNDGDVTPEQKAALLGLLEDIATRNKLDRNNIVGHGEIQGGPGGNREVNEGSVAKEFRTGVSIARKPDDGAPAPVGQRSIVQFAGMKPSSVTDATAEGETKLEGAGDATTAKLPSKYQHIPYDKLTGLKKINETKRNERNMARLWEYKQMLSSDVESRRTSGKGVDGLDAELANIKRTVDKSVWNNYEVDSRKADLTFQATDGLEDLSETDLRERLVKLAPSPGTPDYSVRADVRTAAINKVKSILDARDNDPARAVGGDDISGLKAAPEVTKALADIQARKQDAADGAIFDDQSFTPDDWATLIEARKASQERLGLRPVPLTKAEAKALLDLPAHADPGTPEYMERLQAASDRAEMQFGPKLAKEVFRSAIELTTKGKIDPMAQGIMMSMASGDDVSAEDLRKLAQARAIDRTQQAFLRTVRPELGDEGSGPFVSPSFSKASQKGQDLGPKGRKPTQQEIEAIRRYPHMHKLFDANFGRGAAARVLSEPNAAVKGAK